MSLIRNLPISSVFLLPVLPCLIHFLLNPALFKKVAFLPLYEPTDKDVALVDECDGDALFTFVSFSSISREVMPSMFPSARFCLPERAACTIWSIVRSPTFRNVLAK